jgi:ABC-type lipoprotein release transport system permease subunit
MRKSWFIFRLILLNTFKRKFRAGLAIGGIALSTCIMIVLFGISEGLRTLVTDTVSSKDVASVVTVSQRNQQVALDQSRLSQIKSISGVGSVEQSIGLIADITYHGITLNVPAYGISDGYFTSSPPDTIAGEPRGQPTTGSDSIIISTKTAEALSIPPKEALKKKIKITSIISQDHASTLTTETKRLPTKEYTIVAVVDKQALPVIYTPIEDLFKNGVDSISQAKLTLTVPDRAPAVRESVERLGFQTTSVQDSIDEVNKVFNIVQRILVIFGIIALSITVFGTFNVITLTLIEETSQIGFLRIMGMQRHDVGFMFITQSILLTTTGALLGITAGIMFGAIINELVRMQATEESLGFVIYLFRIPVLPVIITLMLSIGLGWLVGALPAKRATVINPLDELRL